MNYKQLEHSRKFCKNKRNWHKYKLYPRWYIISFKKCAEVDVTFIKVNGILMFNFTSCLL